MTATNPQVPRKKVAIVGSGVAGIGALWALNRSHHDVYMYEAANRLGGHSNTVQFKNGKHLTDVDAGFVLLNSTTYPNFLAFLNNLKIPTEPTEVTSGVSKDDGAFEWSGSSLSSIFAQRRNIFSPRMWRMLFDIIRFNQFSLDLLNQEERVEAFVNGTKRPSRREETIGQYLEREGYGDAFRDNYLIPMTAALLSTSSDKCILDFSALTLVRFMWSHHLLSNVSARPQWMTLKYCAKSYVNAVMRGFPPNHLFLGTPVKSVRTDKDGRVRLSLENGDTAVYDHVIIATHGNQARDLILRGASFEEREILSGFETSTNHAFLHSDLSLMPRSRRAWSALNYITESSPSSANADQVCLTYNMNTLQSIPESVFGPVLLTLNPLHSPNPQTIQGHWTYSHALYNSTAIRSQKLLKHIQNTRGISYCGAWTSYGFHEDGFTSGLRVAQEHLGAKLPFRIKDSAFSRARKPVLTILDLALRVLILVIQMFILFLVRGIDLVDDGVVRGSRLVAGTRSRLNVSHLKKLP